MIWYHLFVSFTCRSHFVPLHSISSSVSIFVSIVMNIKETIRLETFECSFFRLSFSYFFTTTEFLFKSQQRKNGNQIEFMSNHWTHKKISKKGNMFSVHTNSMDSQRHYLFSVQPYDKREILFFLHEFNIFITVETSANQHQNLDSSIFFKYVLFYFIFFALHSFRW